MRDRTEADFRPEPGKIALVGVGVIVLLVIVLGVAGSFYSVPPDSEGVVLRFGDWHATTPPGLHGKLPFGIDRVAIVPVKKVSTLEFGFQTVKPGKQTEYRITPQMKEEALMLTGDLNMASVDWVVQYKIKDSKQYLFTVLDVEDTIRDASDAVMRRLVGDRSVDEVITSGRDALEGEAKDETQRLIDGYGCGIEIVTLALGDSTPPEPVKDAFDAVNRAQQKKDEIINVARAERNRLIPAARGERQRKIAEAEGYREEKVRSATGRAQALLAQYAEYEKRPRETRLRLFMETMEEVYKRAGRKIIVDPDVKGVLPFLDLGAESKGGVR